MGVLEVILLLAGVVLAVLSFVLPSSKDELARETRVLAKEEIKTMVDSEMDGIRQHVDDVVDEAIGYAVEKTERSLERLTNEKIMAVNEYSDTVLQEIHKNHEETMFLYDMLNAKHDNLKDTISEAGKAVQEAKETIEKMEPMQENLTAVQRLSKHKAAEPPAETVSPAPAIHQAEAVSDDKTEKIREWDFLDTAKDPGTNNNEQILALHKQGKSTIAIARELGLGVGEVKLVIDLYKNS